MQRRVERRRSRCAPWPSRVLRPRSRPTCARQLSPALGESLRRPRPRPSSSIGPRRADGGLARRFDRAFPHTLRIAVVPEMPVAVLPTGILVVARRRRCGGSSPSSTRGAQPGCRGSGSRATSTVQLGEAVSELQLRAIAAVAPLVRSRFPLAVAFRRRKARGAHARPPRRARAPARRQPRPAGEARGRAARDSPARAEPAATWTSACPTRPVAGENLNSQVEGRDFHLDASHEVRIDNAEQGDVPSTRKGTSSPRCSTRASGRETSRHSSP